jgi:hypothetical protein
VEKSSWQNQPLTWEKGVALNPAQLEALLGPGTPESLIAVDSDLVDRILTTIGVAGSPLEAPARAQIIADFGQLAEDPFQLRVGGWRLDVRKSVVQATVASALMIGAINLAGGGNIPVEVLAIALPFLVDVERIELSTADKYVLGRMRLRNLQPDAVKTWWKALPERLREEMTYLEFLDLIDRLREAGAIELEPDGTASLKKDRPRLRLRWK